MNAQQSPPGYLSGARLLFEGRRVGIGKQGWGGVRCAPGLERQVEVSGE